MTNLNEFTKLYQRYRKPPFDCEAHRAASYARARMWLDEHAYETRNGEFCEPKSLEDAERVGYTGVVWMYDDCFDVDDFYGFEEPEQTRATNELREKIRSGEWAALVLYLLVDGEIIDSLGSIVVGHNAAERERFELDMASAWVDADRSGQRLVDTGFAL